MGVIVNFDYQKWSTLYPEFADTVTPDQAELYFELATFFHRNDGGGPVTSSVAQLGYLNMMTAHLAYLGSGTKANPASQIVGRISAATEGTVNVTIENKYPEGSAQWYQQTKYGSMYWTVTRVYRTARYLARPTLIGTLGGIY